MSSLDYLLGRKEIDPNKNRSREVRKVGKGKNKKSKSEAP